MKTNLTLGSLFSGSGGFELAGLLNDITPKWASEVEPYPIRVTTERLPQVKHLGDVSKINGAEIEPVDIITFGSPCQDLSVAGVRKGLHEGERSSLFFQAIRIIREMRQATNNKYPRFLVWENVPGAFSSNKGEDFKAVLEAIGGLCENGLSISRPKKWSHAGAMAGDGWSLAWRVYDAQYWGVPQRRKRIYLIADFAGERAGEILFERESVSRDFEPGRKAWEGITTDAERSVGGSGFTESGYAKWTEGVGTLRSAGGTIGGGLKPSFSVVYDARGNGDASTVPTITGDHENRITDYTAVLVERKKNE